MRRRKNIPRMQFRPSRNQCFSNDDIIIEGKGLSCLPEEFCLDNSTLKLACDLNLGGNTAHHLLPLAYFTLCNLFFFFFLVFLCFPTMLSKREKSEQIIVYTQYSFFHYGGKKPFRKKSFIPNFFASTC